MSLRRGDRGDEVKVLQRALNAHGFNLYDNGVFDEKTEEAVKTFQRRKSLNDDGIAGKNTLVPLGLDAHTLQSLSGGDSSLDSDVEVITFTEENVSVPPLVKQRICEFAQRV